MIANVSFGQGAHFRRAAAWLKLSALVAFLGLSFPEFLRNGYATPACDPPILAGKWRLKEMAATNKMTGEWTEAGQVTTLEGEVYSTAVPGSGFFTVDCNGRVAGQGRDDNSGRVRTVSVGPGFRVTTTTDYSGFQTYSITGTVVPGPALEMDVTVTGGFTRADGQSVVEAPPVVQTLPFSETRPATGSFHQRVPITRYDPDTGIIEVDLSNSTFFQQMQAIVDGITSGQPMEVEYSGGATYENTTPIVVSLTPEYTQYFLKRVPAMNKMTATVKWRNAGTPQSVEFKYGDHAPASVPATGDTAEIELDMGDEMATTVTAIADGGGEKSEPFTISLTKVPVSPWADPEAGLSGSAGINYRGTLHWPPQPNISAFFGDAPLVGGLWSLLTAGSRNDLHIWAHSGGPPPGDGDLDWKFHLGVPFTSHQIDFELKGSGRTTITGSGLKLDGSATVPLVTETASKHIGLGTLVPGIEAAACGLSDSLCNFVHGIGITGTLSFDLDGIGKFEASETDTEPKWKSGSAKATLSADVMISLVPPPLDSVLTARVSGGGTACLTLQFVPNIEVTHFGADLHASYEVSLIFVSLPPGNYNWPLVGGGCGSTPIPAPARRSESVSLAAAEGVPTDGQPSIALGPNGKMAVAWSSPSGGNTRPSGDIFVALIDGARRVTTQITRDIQADHAPSVTFAGDGKVLVVWQRNASMTMPSGLAQFSELASGFEIAWAALDFENGNILANGNLTTNTDFDFGTELVSNASGDVMLAWQSVGNGGIIGDAEHPASIMTSFWDGTQWSAPQPAAENLNGLFGWRAAVESANRAAIICTIDGDTRLETEGDREIYLIQREAGAWNARRRMTSNAELDGAPQAAYLGDGRLAVGWMRGDRVIGVIGNLDAPPAVWIERSDLLNLSFSQAQLLARGDRLAAIWPTANDLYAVEIPVRPGAVPETPRVIRRNLNEVETAFRGDLDENGELRYGAIAAGVERADLPSLAPLGEIAAGSVELGGEVPAPVIRFVGIAGGTRIRIEWESVTGTVYVLQNSSDLRAWNDGPEITAAENQTALETDMIAGGTARFFRIRTK